MFFWNSLAFSRIQRILTILSLVPLAFLKSTWIWKFTVHVLLKPGLENFEHYFTSVWDECNCAEVWTFFGIAFWDWNENWPFPVLWLLLNFPNWVAYWLTPQKRCHFHYRGLEGKSRKSRDTWSNRQIWLWSTEWSRAKANWVLPRKCTGPRKHHLPTTQEKILHIDITWWSIPKSDWLYSL